MLLGPFGSLGWGWGVRGGEGGRGVETMYKNAIYICISWYGKFADFRWKNVDVSWNQKVCHMVHIFFRTSLGKVTLASFIIVRCVWRILGRGVFFPLTPPPSPIIREESRKKPILNRVKYFAPYITRLNGVAALLPLIWYKRSKFTYFF